MLMAKKRNPKESDFDLIDRTIATFAEKMAEMNMFLINNPLITDYIDPNNIEDTNIKKAELAKTLSEVQTKLMKQLMDYTPQFIELSGMKDLINANAGRRAKANFEVSGVMEKLHELQEENSKK